VKACSLPLLFVCLNAFTTVQGYVGFKQKWVEIGRYSVGRPQI